MASLRLEAWTASRVASEFGTVYRQAFDVFLAGSQCRVAVVSSLLFSSAGTVGSCWLVTGVGAGMQAVSGEGEEFIGEISALEHWLADRLSFLADRVSFGSRL